MMIAEEKYDSLKNIKDTQQIRFWVDLVIIPSLMFSIAYKGKVSSGNKILLYAIAGATLGYNLGNYLKFRNEEILRDSKDKG